MERENCHRAARHGTDAVLIMDEKGNTPPLRRMAHDVLSALAETAIGLGEGDKMDLIAGHIDGKPGYMRQRQVFQEGGTLKDVVKFLVSEMDEDLARFEKKPESLSDA